MPLELTPEENKVRLILVGVASGSIPTRKAGLISYKEVWQRISAESWNQAKTKEVVRLITKVAAFEVSQHRPPLNELVVRTTRLEPVEPWSDIKRYLKKEFGVLADYASHQEAQEHCRAYWGAVSPKEREAEEGYIQDRTVNFRARNAQIILARKRIDDYTCQACGFRLQISDVYVIDCHHRKPLGQSDEARITKESDLVCLCPTCHRIAHTGNPPLEPDVIQTLRRAGEKG